MFVQNLRRCGANWELPFKVPFKQTVRAWSFDLGHVPRAWKIWKQIRGILDLLGRTCQSTCQLRNLGFCSALELFGVTVLRCSCPFGNWNGWREVKGPHILPSMEMLQIFEKKRRGMAQGSQEYHPKEWLWGSCFLCTVCQMRICFPNFKSSGYYQAAQPPSSTTFGSWQPG